MMWTRRWLGRREGKLPVTQNHSSFNFEQSSQSSSMHWSHLDNTLIWLIFGVLVFGWVMVYSASIAIPDNPRFSSIGEMHFVLRHGLNLVLGAILATLAFRVPMDTWRKLAPWIFGLSVLLLILVFLPGVGVIRNGARRWISLGFMNFQPSELAKLGILLYAADYMVRKVDVKERFWPAVYPMLLALTGVGTLLLAEPDMGAFMVITVIALGILFFGGVNARMFILTAITTVIAFALILFFSDWRRERILAYLDPWSAEHALNKGYQLTNSLIGIGRGEIFGVGLGGSLEKLHWLPEVHTDFITAVIGEELGFVGLVSLILVFAWIVRRMMSIGRLAIARDRFFSGLVAQGVGLWLGFQVFVNMGVNLGVLPTKGLTLPLISYGGSAMVFNLIAIALVLRVDYENRRFMAGREVS